MTAKFRAVKSSTATSSASKSNKGEEGADPQCNKCIACLETLPMSSFPRDKITNSCTHQPNICRSCLSKCIKVQQETRMWDHISCPRCLGDELSRLDYEDIRRFADATTFKRHEYLTLRHSVSAHPDFMWCLSCDSGQRHDGSNGPVVICIACNSRACFDHKVPWHEGLTCRQYDGYDAVEMEKTPKTPWTCKLRHIFSRRRDLVQTPKPETESLIAQGLMRVATERKEQANLTSATIEKSCRICPNPSCNAPIQKSQGCSRITCTKCSCEFCFRCLCKWEFGHYGSCNVRNQSGMLQTIDLLTSLSK